MNRDELVKKRAALIEEMDKMTEGKEQLTEEERKAFDALELQVKEIDSDIKRADDLETAKRNIPGPSAGGISEKDKKDLESYSITKALRSYANQLMGNGKMEGVELEMHQEAQREMSGGKLELRGLGIPTIIHSRADLKATVNASGGYTVATDTMGLIPSLRNSMASVQAGAQLMPGLTGNVAFPRRATDSTASWRSEGGTAPESEPTYEQVTLTPKWLTSYVEFSRQLLNQSSINVDAEVSDTLYYAVANALETAVYAGSGSSNQPTGILNATGVNDADHGSNGTILNWANIVQMEKMVAVDNALKAKLAYITNATAAAKMKVTKKDTYQGGWIWENFTPLTKGMVNGYDAFITNTISSAITRGSNSDCSAVIFGDWSQLLIGQWGAVDLIVNPYSLDTKGMIRVTIAGYYDIAIKQPKAFAAIAGLEN